MKAGIALVQLLQDYGVEVVFGIPGTHSIELYRGLSQSAIQHILPRHEQGAGFMADGYARVSGKPGVCFVITGPGVTNIATAMAQAMSDAVPMLVISPVNDAADGNLGRLHELDDQAAVARPYTVFSEYVRFAEQIPDLLNRAFAVFSNERPGPVHLHIPLSVLRSEVSQPWAVSPVQMLQQTGLQKVARVVTELRTAQAPVIVAGGGCRHLAEQVVRLAERLACPVTTTVAGRGVIPGTHPLCLGAQTGAPPVQQFIAEADLLLVLGSELAEPDHWQALLALPERQIWVNLDATLLQRQADALTLQADLNLLLPALIEQLPMAKAETRKSAYARCERLRARLRQDFSPLQQQHWRVLTELRKSLPAGVRVFSDMTQLAYTAIDYMPLQQANSWMHPNGYGTLGYALPAAMGASFSHTEDPMLVIVGDAGFQYTSAELAVAAQYHLNIVVLLWQNHALQQISDDMQEAGFTPFATSQPNPDFLALAQVYGWAARSIVGLFELGSALESAFTTAGPVLLELDQNRL